MSKIVALKKGAVDGRQARPERKAQGGGTRTAWVGVAKEELTKQGGILLAMLVARANELGHQLQEMASELGVTYGYIAQLRSGVRQPQHISEQFATACARYLNVPRMTVLLASGRVKPEDVLEEPHEAARAIPHAIEYIAKHHKWGALVPPELKDDRTSYALKFLVVSLFETATHLKLIPKRADPANIAEQILQFQKYQAALAQQVAADKAAKQSAQHAGEPDDL